MEDGGDNGHLAFVEGLPLNNGSEGENLAVCHPDFLRPLSHSGCVNLAEVLEYLLDNQRRGIILGEEVGIGEESPFEVAEFFVETVDPMRLHGEGAELIGRADALTLQDVRESPDGGALREGHGVENDLSVGKDGQKFQGPCFRRDEVLPALEL